MYNAIPMQEVNNPLPLSTQLGTAKIAIVRSSYYADLVDAMEKSAQEELMSTNIAEGDIQTITVPGSFEIPLACQIVAPEVDGIVAIGIIIQGETHHAEEIARACTNGLMRVQIETKTPVAHEVLFVDSLKQAEERSLGKNNKGKEAARTLLQMIAMMNKI